MPIAKYAPLSLKIRKAIGKLIKAPNIPVIGIAIRGLNPENIVRAKRRYPPNPTNACWPTDTKPQYPANKFQRLANDK